MRGNLYEEVRNLLQASEESIEMYNTLKRTMIYGGGDILYIYRTNQEARKEFRSYVARHRNITYNTARRKVVLPEGKIIYFKSIDECNDKLIGYKLKEIKFMEE